MYVTLQIIDDTETQQNQHRTVVFAATEYDKKSTWKIDGSLLSHKLCSHSCILKVRWSHRTSEILELRLQFLNRIKAT